MKDETIFTLVTSTNRGRYALDDPQTGHEITSDEVLSVLLGGQWIEGSVEHGSELYAVDRWKRATTLLIEMARYAAYVQA